MDLVRGLSLQLVLEELHDICPVWLSYLEKQLVAISSESRIDNKPDRLACFLQRRVGLSTEGYMICLPRGAGLVKDLPGIQSLAIQQDCHCDQRSHVMILPGLPRWSAHARIHSER